MCRRAVLNRRRLEESPGSQRKVLSAYRHKVLLAYRQQVLSAYRHKVLSAYRHKVLAAYRHTVLLICRHKVLSVCRKIKVNKKLLIKVKICKVHMHSFNTYNLKLHSFSKLFWQSFGTKSTCKWWQKYFMYCIGIQVIWTVFKCFSYCLLEFSSKR